MHPEAVPIRMPGKEELKQKFKYIGPEKERELKSSVDNKEGEFLRVQLLKTRS